MQNRTIGIVATLLTAVVCGCASLFSCVWGIVIATGQPINIQNGDVFTQRTASPTIGYVLLCLTVLMLLVPVAVGFFTLRKKPDTTGVEVPPAS